MVLIEGVGDEVVIFMSIVFLIACIMLAWFSTSVAEQTLIRTAVLVIERRRTSSINNESGQTTNTIEQASTSEPRSIVQVNKSSNSCEPSASSGEELITMIPSFIAETSDDAEAGPSGVRNEEKPVVGIEELYAVVEEKSSDLQARKRITSKEPIDESSIDLNHSDVAIEELVNSDSNNLGVIRIRLKFLNETQRMVEGKLEEPLGEFKRRYFGDELENNKIVRLIFNGQLLRSDQDTLQFYGLFDNCVVHCQISNNASSTPSNQSETYNELDLSRFMLPLFGVILGAIWYCRIQYRQFFNATSTFALLGITGLFFVSLVALFIPRRENRQPVWATMDDLLRR